MSRTIQQKADSFQETAITYKLDVMQDFFSLSEDLLAVSGLEGTLLQVSASWKDVLGFELSEMQGNSVFDWVLPGDVAQIKTAFAQAASNASSQTISFTVECKHQTNTPRLLAWRICRSEDGSKICCIAKDITKQQQTDRAIQHVRQGISAKIGVDFFQQMVNALAQAVHADFAFVGKLLHDQTVQTIALCHKGVTAANIRYDLKGTPCKDVLSGEACSFSHQVAKLYPEDLLLQEMEIEGYIGIPLHNSNGDPIGLLVTLFRKPIENYQFVESILRIFSSRTAAEIERMRVMEEARKLALIAEETDNAVVIADRNRQIYWVNKGFSKMTGYAQAEVIGMKANIFLEGSDGKGDFKGKRSIWEALSKGKAVKAEIMNRRKDGSPIWVDVNIQPIFDKEGKIDSYISIQNDITKRKQYEQTLQKQNDDLKKANEELDTFVYRVSHDLRSPLSSALGLLELMQSETDMAIMQEYISLLARSLDKQDAFIQDILTYSRNSKQEVKHEPVDFDELIAQVMEQVAHIPEAKRMRKDLQIHQPQPFISDGHRLLVVLGNLISNAVRYSNPYIDEPYVSLSVSVSEAEATIRVSDNGIGIGKEHIDKVFQMFYRATDRKNGSGLGLYLVKDSVERMGGKVTVTSEIGVGTSFQIHLPNKR